MKQRNGFTLIELLVVIAIIAVLAAILFPVFLMAKAKGQQASCASNMKQMGVALQSYLSDWDDCYPINRYRDPLLAATGPMDNTRFNWKTSIWPYIKTKNDVWRCQANFNKMQPDEAGKDISGINHKSVAYPISYALNGEFFNDLYDDCTLPPIKAGVIKRPTKLIFVVETRFDAPDLTLGQLDTQRTSWRCRPGKGWLQVHLNGTSNFLFADTHMANLKVSKTLTPEQMWYDQSGRKWMLKRQSDYDALATKLPPDCY